MEIQEVLDERERMAKAAIERYKRQMSDPEIPQCDDDSIDMADWISRLDEIRIIRSMLTS